MQLSSQWCIMVAGRQADHRRRCSAVPDATGLGCHESLRPELLCCCSPSHWCASSWSSKDLPICDRAVHIQVNLTLESQTDLHEGVADGLRHLPNGHVLLHVGALPAGLLDLQGQGHVLSQRVHWEEASLRSGKRLGACRGHACVQLHWTTDMQSQLMQLAFWIYRARAMSSPSVYTGKKPACTQKGTQASFRSGLLKTWHV